MCIAGEPGHLKTFMLMHTRIIITAGSITRSPAMGTAMQSS